LFLFNLGIPITGRKEFYKFWLLDMDKFKLKI
jgi:hypothetical protein